MSTSIPDPVELLRDLIRFNTTNPPGNERECIGYVHDLLANAGCDSLIVGNSPERPNLIARLPGSGNVPPLLLHGHVDVVPADEKEWHHPPFEAQLVDGYIWGRGALDMKGGVVMMLTAFLRAKAEQKQLPGDVVLVLVSDEEAGGEFGAGYLVKSHAEQFQGIKYAIGEFGGFSYDISGKRFYPIMVAEKQACWLRAKVSGAGGHGSLFQATGTMAALATLIQRLERRRLPIHVTPVARMMFRSLAANLPFPAGLLFRGLSKQGFAATGLKIMGTKGQPFQPLLRNTVNATMIHAGDRPNVVPSRGEVLLDGRILPGLGLDEFISELGDVLGPEVELEVMHFNAAPAEPDMGLFDNLSEVLRHFDPDGIPAPMLMPASTDGRYYSQLGIQTYGFLPMKLPAEFAFSSTIHGIDERIPVESLEFGCQAVYRLLETFGRE